jgi:hypothetical protein
MVRILNLGDLSVLTIRVVLVSLRVTVCPGKLPSQVRDRLFLSSGRRTKMACLVYPTPHDRHCLLRSCVFFLSDAPMPSR